MKSLLALSTKEAQEADHNFSARLRAKICPSSPDRILSRNFLIRY
jgi:hypothetical protein